MTYMKILLLLMFCTCLLYTSKQYNKCMRGAGDTVRSIIISANSRLAFLENKQVLRLLSKDELNLSDIGIGVNGDGETKTALFCVIPDSDKSYNFIIGMLYTQIFQELYYQADFNCGGRLPIHVTFMLDEFANVALPDDCLLYTSRFFRLRRKRNMMNYEIFKEVVKEKFMDYMPCLLYTSKESACCVRIINHRGREVRPYPQKAKRGDSASDNSDVYKRQLD